MQELTELLGEDLADYIVENDITFIPGWHKNSDTLKLQYYSMKISVNDSTFEVRYKTGFTFLIG